MHLDELEHNNLSFIFIFSICSFCWHLSLFHKLCAPCCINIKPELQSVERFLPPRRFVGCPHSLDDNNNIIDNTITTWTYSLSLATSHPIPARSRFPFPVQTLFGWVAVQLHNRKHIPLISSLSDDDPLKSCQDQLYIISCTSLYFKSLLHLHHHHHPVMVHHPPTTEHDSPRRW